MMRLLVEYGARGDWIAKKGANVTLNPKRSIVSDTHCHALIT